MDVEVRRSFDILYKLLKEVGCLNCWWGLIMDKKSKQFTSVLKRYIVLRRIMEWQQYFVVVLMDYNLTLDDLQGGVLVKSFLLLLLGMNRSRVFFFYSAE